MSLEPEVVVMFPVRWPGDGSSHFVRLTPAPFYCGTGELYGYIFAGRRFQR
jgi:hypothetical protein